MLFAISGQRVSKPSLLPWGRTAKIRLPLTVKYIMENRRVAKYRRPLLYNQSQCVPTKLMVQHSVNSTEFFLFLLLVKTPYFVGFSIVQEYCRGQEEASSLQSMTLCSINTVHTKLSFRACLVGVGVGVGFS